MHYCIRLSVLIQLLLTIGQRLILYGLYFTKLNDIFKLKKKLFPAMGSEDPKSFIRTSYRPQCTKKFRCHNILVLKCMNWGPTRSMGIPMITQVHKLPLPQRDLDWPGHSSASGLVFGPQMSYDKNVSLKWTAFLRCRRPEKIVQCLGMDNQKGQKLCRPDRRKMIYSLSLLCLSLPFLALFFLSQG